MSKKTNPETDGAETPEKPDETVATEAPVETPQDAVTAEPGETPEATEPAEEIEAKDASTEDPAEPEEAPTEEPTEAQTAEVTDAEVIEEAPRNVEEPPQEPEPREPEPRLDAEEDPEPHHSSFASTALMLLIGAIFVSGVTLWGAPKLAPYLPGSIATYLAPASETAQREIDTLKSRLDALEEIRGRVAVLEAVDMSVITTSLSEATTQAEANQTAITDLAAIVASSDTTSQETAESLSQVTNDFSALSADLASLKTELGALEAAVATVKDEASGTVPVTEELKTAVAALQSRLTSVDERLAVLPTLATKTELAPLASTEALETTRAELTGEIAATNTAVASQLAAMNTELAAQIADVNAKADAAQEVGQLALNETQSSLRGTAVRGVATQLSTLVTQGAPYAEPLAELERLSGIPAPDALAAASQEGVVAMASLREAFPAAARAALAADQQPVQGEGAVARISSWFGAQVSVRPTQPIEGPSTGAVLSRMEAAIKADDGAKALAEADGLPEAAAGAMADWLANLSSKVSAEAALAPYITAAGGES